jgi:hypothetical protein
MHREGERRAPPRRALFTRDSDVWLGGGGGGKVNTGELT